jgi:molecular chaperone GrpE
VTAPDRDERIVDDPDQVVVRDKRRLDPESGALRAPADASTAEASPAEGDVPPAAQEPDRVAELTADLQRLSAEYANYRKRVERDRVAVVEMATAGLLSGLLPVLDDVERARQHGDLTGGFQAVGEALEALTAKLGLERFGEVGEPFDPSVHEALMQAEPDPAATVAVCAAVFQPGFRMSGGRVLRPARVSVAEPGAVEQPAPAAAES